MGEESDLNTSPNNTNNQDVEYWFADYADSLCAYYMAIGVSCHDYWHGDYSILHYYVEADELKRERENESAWLQGLYVYDAVGCLAPILHAFAKRGTKPSKYPDKPYAITEKQRKMREEQKRAEDAAKAQAQVMAWINQMRKKFGGKEESNG